MKHTQLKIKNSNRKNILFIISILFVILATLSPGLGIREIYNLDKIVHFLIFFLLSISICNKYNNNKTILKGMFLAITFGFITEVAQKYIPGRDMDIYDGLTDTFGVISAYLAYKIQPAFFDKIFLKKRI